MSEYFPNSFRSFGKNINVKVDLSNYAIKSDIKNISHVDTSIFALKSNEANLKSEVDKLDIGKLVPVPTDLIKLRNVVKHDVVKKTVYDKLVTKVNAIPLNNIETSDFVLKTKYDTDKSKLEKKKNPNLTHFVKKAKITELENKIPGISNLRTKTALTTVENKIPSVTNLFKNAGYNTKITEIENKLTDHNHDKYIDTQEFNKLAADVFNARIAQANLITKTDFDSKLSNLNRKITSYKTKHLLVENELNELKIFDLSFFIDKSRFEEDGTQNCLVFQPIIRYFKVNTLTNTQYISSRKSKGLSAENIKRPTTSDNSLTPELNYYSNKIRVKFTGTCLKQSKISYTHSTIVNIYIVYELGASSSHNNDPT